MTENIEQLIRLVSCWGIGPRKVLDLRQKFSSLENVFNARLSDLLQVRGITKRIASEILKNPDTELIDAQIQLMQKYDTGVVTYWEEAYPAALKEIYNPPVLLFYRGDLDLLSRKSLAIVGTRKPTAYGKETSEKFSTELSNQGYCIVSGAARGVDTHAHRACLSAGGKTIAVLGCGVDRVYPAENRQLLSNIAQEGLIISEFLMGAKPDAPNFPQRNRIISGLSAGTLVVEAAEKSGSLITAYYALDQNREVFAIPGNISSSQSRGTHKLIQQGAKLVTGVEDVLEELGEKFRLGVSNGQQSMSFAVSSDEQKILDKLPHEESIHIDDLADKCGVSAFSLLTGLLQLEMNGLVQQMPGKFFTKK